MGLGDSGADRATEVGSIVAYMRLVLTDWDAGNAKIKADSAELGRLSPSIHIQTNSGEVIGQLALVQAQAKATADSIGGRGGGSIMQALLALSPAAIPIGGVLTGALAGAVPVAIARAAGIKGITEEQKNGSLAGTQYASDLATIHGWIQKIEQASAGGLLKGIDTAVQGSRAEFGPFKNEIADVATELGKIGGEVGPSVLQLLVDLEPLFNTLGGYVEQGAQAFQRWVANGGDIESFIGYVQKELPHVVQFFGDAATAVEHIIQASAPLGSTLIADLDELARLIDSMPIWMLTALVDGIVALKVASTVAKGVDALSTSLRGLRSAEEGAAAASSTGLIAKIGGKAGLVGVILTAADAIGRAGDGHGLIDHVHALGQQIGGLFTGHWDQLNHPNALKDAGKAAADASQDYAQLDSVVKQIQDAFGGLHDVIDEITASINANAAASGAGARALADYIDTLGRYNEALNAAGNATTDRAGGEDVGDPTAKYIRQAHQAYTDAVKAQQEAAAKAAKSAASAGAPAANALAQRQQQAAQDAVDLANAYKDTKAAIAQAKTDATEQTLSLAKQATDYAVAADKAHEAYKKAYAAASAAVTAEEKDPTQANLDKAKQALNRRNAAAQAYTQALTNSRQADKALADARKQNAQAAAADVVDLATTRKQNEASIMQMVFDQTEAQKSIVQQAVDYRLAADAARKAYADANAAADAAVAQAARTKTDADKTAADKAVQAAKDAGDKYVQAAKDAQDKINAVNQQVIAAITARDQDIQTLAGNVAGSFDITAGPASLTAETRASDKAVAQAQEFVAGLIKLAQEGLGKDEVMRIASKGISQLPLVRALLKATPAQIAHLASNQATIGGLGAYLGTTLAALYDQGAVDAANSQLASLGASVTLPPVSMLGQPSYLPQQGTLNTPTVTVPITVNPSPGMDETALAVKTSRTVTHLVLGRV